MRFWENRDIFSKLRNRILILNAATVSLLMIGAFAAIYLMTAQSVNEDNERALSTNIGQIPSAKLSANGEIPINDIYSGGYLDGFGIMSDVFNLNEDGSVTSVGDSSLTYDGVTIDQGALTLRIWKDWIAAGKPAQELRYSASGESSTTWYRGSPLMSEINYSGRKWVYQIVRLEEIPPGETMVESLSAAAINPPDHIVPPGTYRMVAMDITFSQEQLRALLLRLIIIGAVVIAALVVFSWFFANRSVKPVRESYERQRRFIADASHELKTPLAIVTANHDALLVHENETIASQREWLDYARAGTDRMTRLVSSLLSLSNAENDCAGARSHTGKTEFDLVSMVCDEAALFKARAAAKGIDFTVGGSCADSPLPIIADKEAISGILRILIDNAILYADESGRVGVNVDLNPTYPAISVSNTGPGIEKDDLPHIFERFYRADQARANADENASSYGLGLSIARALADGAGLSLTAESEPGSLTVFRLQLA
jgi:signal transduction histidine kinase